MSTPENPFAFPNNSAIEDEGMTLRDYFAAKAMEAIIIGNSADFGVTSAGGAIGTASDAYVIADAMLKARATP